MRVLVVASLIVAGFARSAAADMWRDYGSWIVRQSAAFGCQHRESLALLSQSARGNDQNGFERAMREQMIAGECEFLEGGTHVLIYENLPAADLRKIRVIGEYRFLWLPFNVVQQGDMP